MANQPFRVNSISLPIVGANYLDTAGPNLIPLPQLRHAEELQLEPVFGRRAVRKADRLLQGCRA